MQSRNPFEPPQAPVGAPDPSGDIDAPPMQRPSTIVLAFWLLIASAGLALLAVFIPGLETSAFIVAFTLAYLVGFAFLFRAGKNWARIVYLVFFCLGAFGIATHIEMLARHGALPAVFMGVNTACQGYAAWLTFRPPGSAWFRRRS
jgi:hypothetical protein